MNPTLLNNIELNFARKSGVKNRLPSWFRQEIPDDTALAIRHLLSKFGVNTVCQEAKCPNISYCFKNKKLTFMILGNSCTRNCRFCGVSKSESVYLGIDKDEPYRISQLVKILGLKYVVITSVSRDDLPDGGASQFAKTIELIHKINPVRDTTNSNNNSIVSNGVNPVRNTIDLGKESKISNGVKVEVLIPDFQGKISSLECVLDVGPNVVAHNIETVKRLYSDLRPQADYQLSLGLLSKIKELTHEVDTKSSIMLGLGETTQEVISTMEDLKKNKCDILTLGQYLAPSINHYPIKEFINIEQFQKYQDIGLAMGFKSVLSGPLVRSSYRAEELYKKLFLTQIHADCTRIIADNLRPSALDLR